MENNEIKNKVGAKMYLEFAVHLLELDYFNPVVFCHDSFWLEREQYARTVIGFTNLLSFLYSCGLTLETDLLYPTDEETELYRHIVKDEDSLPLIRCYELLEIDYTGFNIEESTVPNDCEAEDFSLVKVYLLLKTGAAINRRSLENVLERRITDSEAMTIRRQLENMTGRKLIKRKDNSYEMR